MSIFADIIRAAGATAQAGVAGYAQKAAATAPAGGGRSGPGCTPCEAMARRQRALGQVAGLRGPKK